MLRANYWGLGMFVVGGLLAGLASLVLIVMDAALRLRSTYLPRWSLSREAGGHLLYIPVWVIGGVVLIINLARAAFS